MSSNGSDCPPGQMETPVEKKWTNSSPSQHLLIQSKEYVYQKNVQPLRFISKLFIHYCSSIPEHLHHLTKTISTEFIRESDIDQENGGKNIIVYEPSTLPTTCITSSNCLNNVHQQQRTVVINTRQENKENRFCLDLIPTDVSNLVHPSDVLPIDSFDLKANRQQTNQVSPSTAVRSIVTDLLRQYSSHPSSPSKSNKRKRSEGTFGEEITSSNMLNELKDKASQQNPSKRIPIRAISTVQAPPSPVLIAD
ncbi:unnamed protein product [Adineta ricciae]|uniref:Uncharacterized protein n=1 Tax=Adineta ricciae TaxID=249248 RepID=A0A815UAE4_ADIRI|nr:unnamed protein product [Adineta ricciae]CAF1514170.1 unnamed protein product [Adineta ricciae]